MSTFVGQCSARLLADLASHRLHDTQQSNFPTQVCSTDKKSTTMCCNNINVTDHRCRFCTRLRTTSQARVCLDRKCTATSKPQPTKPRTHCLWPKPHCLQQPHVRPATWDRPATQPRSILCQGQGGAVPCFCNSLRHRSGGLSCVGLH